MRGQWIILYVIFMHLLWGPYLVFWSQVDLGVDATWNVYEQLWKDGGRQFGGAIMLFSAVCGFFVFVFRRVWWSFVWLLPQQFILAIGMIGAIANIVGVWDHFSTARLVRSAFPAILIFVFHLAAVIDHIIFSVKQWMERRSSSL